MARRTKSLSRRNEQDERDEKYRLALAKAEANRKHYRKLVARSRRGEPDVLIFLGHKWLGQELSEEDAERIAKDKTLY
jgi:hypothetical protein